MALRRVFLPQMGQLLRDRQRISRALQDSQVHAVTQAGTLAQHALLPPLSWYQYLSLVVDCMAKLLGAACVVCMSQPFPSRQHCYYHCYCDWYCYCVTVTAMVVFQSPALLLSQLLSLAFITVLLSLL